MLQQYVGIPRLKNDFVEQEQLGEQLDIPVTRTKLFYSLSFFCLRIEFQPEKFKSNQLDALLVRPKLVQPFFKVVSTKCKFLPCMHCKDPLPNMLCTKRHKGKMLD
jgi:hypothetical protein